MLRMVILSIRKGLAAARDIRNLDTFLSVHIVSQVKTITLRTLVREPLKVKRMTRGGEPVQVTDHGQPLWIIHAAENSIDEAERLRATDEILDDVLKEAPSKINIVKVLEDSRR